MHKYRVLTTVTASLVCAVAINTGSAMAGNWAPNGATVTGVSTLFRLELSGGTAGTVIINCNSLVITGAIAASATWTATPTFSECGVTTTVTGTWTAKDENATTANLIIPAGSSIAFAGPGGCTVTINPQTFGSAGNYRNGTTPKGITTASKWHLTDLSTTTFTANPANCAANLLISTNFLMLNTTNAATEAIKAS